MVRRAAGALLAGAACLAASAGCSPLWFWSSTVDVEGRILADGRCEVTARGDVTRRLVLAGQGSTASQRHGPPPQPGTMFLVSCLRHSSQARGEDPSNLAFLIPVDDPSAAAPAGTYRVRSGAVGYPPQSPAPRGVVSFLATVDPDPAGPRGERRDYDGFDGTLTLTSVTPNPDARMRDSYGVAGTFRVRARRYFRFS